MELQYDGTYAIPLRSLSRRRSRRRHRHKATKAGTAVYLVVVLYVTLVNTFLYHSTIRIIIVVP